MNPAGVNQTGGLRVATAERDAVHGQKLIFKGNLYQAGDTKKLVALRFKAAELLQKRPIVYTATPWA
ncbi:hypothetical protein GCM10027217_02550 [Pseudomaricurvus hydrocarbonicus]